MNALSEWQHYLEQHGVVGMYLMIGPDKASVYVRHLPKWAAPQPPTRADLLTTNVPHMVDTTATPKTQVAHADDLYYRTDTHWNALDAWQAFTHLMERLQKATQR